MNNELNCADCAAPIMIYCLTCKLSFCLKCSEKRHFQSQVSNHKKYFVCEECEKE